MNYLYVYLRKTHGCVFLLFFDLVDRAVDSTAFACLSSSSSFTITANSSEIFAWAENRWITAKLGYVISILYRYAAN